MTTRRWTVPLIVAGALAAVLWVASRDSPETSADVGTVPELTHREPPPAPARFAGLHWRMDPGELERELECLALNIYWEARSESRLGQVGVAAVTLNRVVARGFPDTICEVIYDGGERNRHRCQFSWWCDGKQDVPRESRAWKQARAVAEDVMLRTARDPTRGALWYHADYVRPEWARYLTPITRIGRHIYYREG